MGAHPRAVPPGQRSPWAELDAPRPAPPAEEGLPWDIRLLSGADFQAPLGRRTGGGAAPAAALPDGLVQRLSWRYPHMASAAIASKLTATQLKGREKDAEVSEYAVELRPAAPQTTLRRPVFEGERPLTPARRNFERLAGEVTRLVEGRYITPQQGNAVNPADILAFFRSELGLRLRRSARVEREFKFSLLAPAADYYPEAEPGEEVLLQGVVDCWFVEADSSVTVVDFKTDRVTQDGVDRRALDYRPQLDAYSRALSQAAGVAVKRRYLWFFHAGRAVEV